MPVVVTLTGVVSSQSVELSAATGAQQITATGQVALQGEPGLGVPAGGTTGQYLAKTSNASNDTQWSTLSKSSVALSNVDNTSDASKPISTATQAALDAKQALDAE